MPEGRPLKFKTVEDMKKLIDAYFEKCAIEKRPLTITGLALALDTSRKVLLEYEDDRPEYRNTIKKAKEMCHNYAEEFLFSGRNIVGAIFNLKNNYGWHEKQETEHSGNVTQYVIQTGSDNLPSTSGTGDRQE